MQYTAVLRGLYAITDSALPAQQLLPAVAAALRGGCRLVQYRDKSGNGAARLQQARDIVTLCNNFNARLLINDDVALALAVGAHGVHLGQQDTPLASARAALGTQAIVGVTCHGSLELARAAEAGGADYVAFGAFFASRTKMNAQRAPLPVLAQAKAVLKIPLVAIGGIDADNAPQLLCAGADMIAVINGLFATDAAFDATVIETRARVLCRLFAAA